MLLRQEKTLESHSEDDTVIGEQDCSLSRLQQLMLQVD